MKERIVEEEYWKDAMNHRQPEWCEIERLISIAKGFYLDELKNDADYKEENSIDLSKYDLRYFVENAKRPFGNKNKAQSIMFNLGWDWDRRLVEQSEPQWVIEEANKLYKNVIKELEDNKYLYE